MHTLRFRNRMTFFYENKVIFEKCCQSTGLKLIFGITTVIKETPAMYYNWRSTTFTENKHCSILQQMNINARKLIPRGVVQRNLQIHVFLQCQDLVTLLFLGLLIRQWIFSGLERKRKCNSENIDKFIYLTYWSHNIHKERISSLLLKLKHSILLNKNIHII